MGQAQSALHIDIVATDSEPSCFPATYSNSETVHKPKFRLASRDKFDQLGSS